MHNRNRLKKLTLSAIFLATGMLLPLLTSQIKEIGDSLLPMHFVVLLCGFICGGKWGSLVGFIMPFLRSLIFSMPPIYPNAVWMSAELATYGAVSGGLFYLFGKKSAIYTYISLISAQIAGRISWAVAKMVLLGVSGKAFTISAFLVGGFVDAFFGIALQIIFIPYIISLVNRSK